MHLVFENPALLGEVMCLMNRLCSSSRWREQIVPANQWKFNWVTENWSPNRHIMPLFDVFSKPVFYPYLINQHNEDFGCGGWRCVFGDRHHLKGTVYGELSPLDTNKHRSKTTACTSDVVCTCFRISEWELIRCNTKQIHGDLKL